MKIISKDLTKTLIEGMKINHQDFNLLKESIIKKVIKYLVKNVDIDK